ncbi:hypothetical protein VNI00_010197 [Paramarasmius palmivorus]|uniref:Uncharacterized protein n=1 Tax=Paramarasmius palmivorus TaxID=297713 RepID=A0AAW0CJW2_9AGAR
MSRRSMCWVDYPGRPTTDRQGRPRYVEVSEESEPEEGDYDNVRDWTPDLTPLPIRPTSRLVLEELPLDQMQWWVLGWWGLPRPWLPEVLPYSVHRMRPSPQDMPRRDLSEEQLFREKEIEEELERRELARERREARRKKRAEAKKRAEDKKKAEAVKRNRELVKKEGKGSKDAGERSDCM